MALELVLGPDDDGRRADRILRKALPELPLSAIHRLFRAGKVRRERMRIAFDTRLAAGDRLEIRIEADTGSGDRGPSKSDTSTAAKNSPEAAPFCVVFRNKDYLVVDKAPGVLVHGRGSLEEAVRDFLAPGLPASLSFRPGPLHRLDQGTGGLIVFSASLEGARQFSKALHDRLLHKEYLALLEGVLTATRVWDDPLLRDPDEKTTRADVGGKQARTTAIPLATAQGMTLARISIEGGRTHQIRSHAGGDGHPLVNDLKYGGSKRRDLADGRFLLHARVLLQDDSLSLNLPRRLVCVPHPVFLSAIDKIFGPEVVRMVLY